MRKPRLIQRLRKPIKKTGTKLDIAHRVFGGGMLGLSEKGWDILDQIWIPDYMGAAEFEWGALPKCLSRLIQNRGNLTFFNFTIPGKSIKKSWSIVEDNFKPKDAKVYVICSEKDVEEVKTVILNLAKDDTRLKEGIRFNDTLQKSSFSKEDQSRLPYGWIDIENDYMFFADSEMFENTKKVLFGEENDK